MRTNGNRCLGLELQKAGYSVKIENSMKYGQRRKDCTIKMNSYDGNHKGAVTARHHWIRELGYIPRPKHSLVQEGRPIWPLVLLI